MCSCNSKCSVFFPDLFVWIPSPVTEGSEVKLSCRHTCSSPSKPTVMWKKNREELPGKQTDNSDMSCCIVAHCFVALFYTRYYQYKIQLFFA